jgi:hypothetical protein
MNVHPEKRMIMQSNDLCQHRETERRYVLTRTGADRLCQRRSMRDAYVLTQTGEGVAR